MITPCSRNPDIAQRIEAFSEVIKTQAHTLPGHGLSEDDFYDTGFFRACIERIRGQISASMSEKRAFARGILNYMQDAGFLQDWEEAGQANRHDYLVTMPTGRVVAIELKGCLDGNNTNIFHRPPNAEEFIIWSICSNPGGDPRRNVWSGIHTRLGAEIIDKQVVVDGIVVWDWLCGTVARPCPKIMGTGEDRTTLIGANRLPPPCIYVFPSTAAHLRHNPRPVIRGIEGVQILKAFHECFGGLHQEVNTVSFEVAPLGVETTRITRIFRNGIEVMASEPTTIRR